MCVQVVKVRLQAREHLGRYRNSFDAVAKIYRESGPRGFLIGLGPTCWRNCVWNSVYFGVMFELKSYFPKYESHAGNLLSTLLSGFAGGMIATTFNAPFDVVKVQCASWAARCASSRSHVEQLTARRRALPAPPEPLPESA